MYHKVNAFYYKFIRYYYRQLLVMILSCNFYKYFCELTIEVFVN